MSAFLSRMIIPVLTLLLPGRTDWFTSNFSVVGSTYPQNILLLLWAIVTGSFFHKITSHIVGQAAPFLSARKELALTDLAVFLLIGAVFLPYLPETNPLIAFVHLAMAFSATVLFFIALTILDLRLYLIQPELFSLPTALLVAAIAICFALLILCEFLITSALEIFITLFACVWIRIFEQRVRLLSEQLSA